MARASRLISRHRVTAVSVAIDDRRGCGRKQIGRVARPSRSCAVVCGSARSATQALRERDQRAGKVAAVDRRDVPRMQRRQRRRVVPVQEVALVTLEPFERRQRPVEALDERRRWRDSRGRARPASTAGPCRCWSATCGVASRGSPSILLVVVGRQPRVVPRWRTSRSSATSFAPSVAAARSSAVERTHARADRHAQPVRDGWRDGPQQEERRRRRPARRVPRRDRARRQPPRSAGSPPSRRRTARRPRRPTSPVAFAAVVAAVSHSSIRRLVTTSRTSVSTIAWKRVEGVIRQQRHAEERSAPARSPRRSAGCAGRPESTAIGAGR